MRWVVVAVLLYYAYGNLGAAWEDRHWQVSLAKYHLASGVVSLACGLAVATGWGM